MDEPEAKLRGVARSAQADERAARLATLVQEHRLSVLALCLAYTRDIHTAEDRVQDVFVKAMNKLDTLRDTTKARAWLRQIARRVCVDHDRRRVAQHPLAEHVARPARVLDSRLERLQTALARLPDDIRETIALYYLDGRSCASVAAALETTEAAVRQRLVRGRLRLHELLMEDEA